MKWPVLIAFAASAMFSLRASAAEPTPQQKTFSAKVADVRLNARLTAQGKKRKDVVSVRVPAAIFAQPIEIGDVRTEKTHSIPEVDVLIRYTKANLEGSAQEIVSFWLPEEMSGKSALLSQPGIFQANRDYHNRNPGLAIIGLVYQSQTTSILLKKPSGVLGVTIAKKDGRLYLTDHPSNDLELAIIESSFE